MSAGERGDVFGSLNALFTGLGFVGLLMTVLYQREDLKEQSRALALQQEELRSNHKEIALQRGEMAKSVIAQEKLVEEARRDRCSQQAMRVLACYASWMTAVCVLRNKLGPTPAVADEFSGSREWFLQLNDCLFELLKESQNLMLLDSEFASFRVAPVSAQLLAKIPADVYYSDIPNTPRPEELMRAAVLSVQILPHPMDVAGRSESQDSFRVPYEALLLADHAQRGAQEIVDRVAVKLQRHVLLPGRENEM